MANVFQCWYMKSAIYRINSTLHSTELSLKYDMFNEQFPHTALDKSMFLTYMKRFNDHNRKKKISQAERSLASNTFSLEKWNKLDSETKILHTLKICQPCKHLSLSIPSNSPQPQISTPTQQTPSLSVPEVRTPTTPLSSLSINIPIPEKPLNGADAVAAKELLSRANESFNSVFGKSFTEVICKVPESKLQLRPTDTERKQKIRKMQRNIKKSLENKIHSHDADVHYGTRQTKSQYCRQRLATFFETKEDATERTKKRKYFISYIINFFGKIVSLK